MVDEVGQCFVPEWGTIAKQKMLEFEDISRHFGTLTFFEKFLIVSD